MDNYFHVLQNPMSGYLLCCDFDDADDVHDHDLKLLMPKKFCIQRDLVSAGIADLYPVIEFGKSTLSQENIKM